MPRRIIRENPDNEFRKLRASGRAALPRDAIRGRIDTRASLSQARYGSLEEDIREFEYARSEGRDLLNQRGYRSMDLKQLASAGPDALDKINQMHRTRTGSQGVGGMGN